MLICSRAKVTVDRTGNVKAEGALAPYQSRIFGFVDEEGINDTSIRLRHGHFQFSGNVTPRTRKKWERFLSAECPLSSMSGVLSSSCDSATVR